jgi:hypothetical protein
VAGDIGSSVLARTASVSPFKGYRFPTESISHTMLVASIELKTSNQAPGRRL